MSKVLKNVQGHFEKRVVEQVRCKNPQCGTIWVIHDDYFKPDKDATERVGKPCSECGNETHHYRNEWDFWVKGYVVVECDCGREVTCQGFTTTCQCGCDYNWNGVQLAPRSEWGLDTGEHWTDCY